MRTSSSRPAAVAVPLVAVACGVAGGVTAALPGVGAERSLDVVGRAAPLVVAVLCVVVLAWAAVARGPGLVLRLAAVLTVGHAATVAASGESLAVAATSPAAGLVLAAVSWPWHVVGAARRDRSRALAGVDALVVAADDLRTADVADVGDRICRLGCDLAAADGALLYVRGPGRLTVAGRHGTSPRPADAEIGGDPAVEAVLRGGPLHQGDPLVVPVLGESGVVAAVALHGARRPLDDVHRGLLGLFGLHAGCAVDRLAPSGLGSTAAETDPVTGVGDRRQASALVAGLRPGDGLLVLEIDGLGDLRRSHSDQAADLFLGRMGLHLRNSTRPGDAIARLGDEQFVIGLRQLKAPVEVVVRRLVDGWTRVGSGRTISIGAALHLDGVAPLDTLERAQEAVASARRIGGGQAHMATDRRVAAV